MSSMWKYLATTVIGGIIAYSIMQQTIQAVEARLARIERAINQLSARVADFESRYQAEIPQLQYEYQVVHRQMDELKARALSHEQMKQL